MKCLIYSLLFILFSINMSASHMFGGEVSYKCNGNNTFHIVLKIYQDCTDGITPVIEQDNPAQYAIYENRPSPRFITSGSIYSDNVQIVPPEFSNECVTNFPRVCLRLQIFETTIKLEPSIYGYTIVYQRCCRNFTVQNIVEPGEVGITYSATIPPFENNVCPNNSPTFNYIPPQIICVNNNFNYNFSCSDIDGDSLVYKLCPSFEGGTQDNTAPSGSSISAPPFLNVRYVPGLSYDNPIYGFPPLFIDPKTGDVNFEPISSGRYQVKICVDEYRNGQYLNTHSRDLQFVITNCSKAVIANTPLYSEEPNTYIVNCENYSVQFKNSSTGGFSYSWDFGDGSEKVNSFEPTHTYSDTGTYTVTLVVNPGSTCTDSIKRIVKIYPTFYANYDVNGKLCKGETITFKDSIFSTYDVPYTIDWYLNDTLFNFIDKQLKLENSGTYKIKMLAKSALGCIAIKEQNIIVDEFAPNAGNDTVIVLGFPFQLNASGGQHYEWFPKTYLSDGYINNPTTSFPDVGDYLYNVKITNNEGCKGEDSIKILVVKDSSILLPNAFSPNGDGLNDIIKPQIIGYPKIKSFKIFNRWGEMVFVSYRQGDGWDGSYKNKPAPSGVYYYELIVYDLQNQTHNLKGDITLIR